jgi:apolipoprotein D and lipocalin family protein
MKGLQNKFFIVMIIFLGALSCQASPPQTVSQVDLPSYLGKWFELYRYPNSFQDNTGIFKKKSPCFSTTAEYSLSLEKGTDINVKNSCSRRDSKGKVYQDIAMAKARIVNNSGDAKLLVNFTGISLLEKLGIGDGDYWILGLGPLNEDNLYSWAMVGSPTRKYAWILSRTPSLNQETLQDIFEQFQMQGFQRDTFISSQGN